jgi:hypothetical protein
LSLDQNATGRLLSPAIGACHLCGGQLELTSRALNWFMLPTARSIQVDANRSISLRPMTPEPLTVPEFEIVACIACPWVWWIQRIGKAAT